MDWDRILEWLLHHPQLLKISQLAELFGRHRNTIEHWIIEYGFPAHIKLDDEVRTSRRYWRPDHAADWVRERIVIEERGIDIDAVAAMVGFHADTWYEWIKNDRAPASKWRALRSGRALWDRDEVEAWLKERTGGYALPAELSRAKPREEKKPKPKTRGAKHGDGDGRRP